MGLLGSRGGGMESPVQQHRVYIANDVQWISGEMETLGNPHNFVNQDGLDYIRINDPHVAPWTFSGLPASHVPLTITTREHIQFIIFPDESAMEQFRPPMKTETLILNLSLAIIRGRVPYLSEAQIHNFLDFWKGIFFPVMDAKIYYLADCAAEQPTDVPLVYINYKVIQSYTEG